MGSIGTDHRAHRLTENEGMAPATGTTRGRPIWSSTIPVYLRLRRVLLDLLGAVGRCCQQNGSPIRLKSLLVSISPSGIHPSNRFPPWRRT